ncbi:unnamed protein product [Ixodes hexagonus]
MPSSGDGLLSSASSVRGLAATLATTDDLSRISWPRSRSSEMSDPETNWIRLAIFTASSHSKVCEDLSGRPGLSANDWIFCMQNWITSFLWVSVLQCKATQGPF